MQLKIGTCPHKLLKLSCFNLQIVADYQEDDEPKSNRVNNGGHFVPNSMSSQVLQDHLLHGAFLEEEEHIGKDNLQEPLKIKGQKRKSKEHAHQDKEEYL